MAAPKPECRLVAVDGNGTLLGTDGASISDFTRDVVQQLEAKGIPVVLATGRPFEKAKATLQRCGMSQYVLTENGARAIRIADSMPVWEMWLEGSDVSATLSRIKAALPSALFAQLTSVGGLVEDSHPWLQADATRAAAEKIFPKAVSDVVAELKTGYRCAKTYVHIPGSDDFSTTMGLVKEAAGTGWEVREIKQLLPSMSRTCEVQSSTVNKADGLRELCQAIGVPMQHVWAFGDDANDVRMLSEVGWGVRMANHLPVLAGVGQDVTDFRNEEDGVAKYLHAHLLSGDVPQGEQLRGHLG